MPASLPADLTRDIDDDLNRVYKGNSGFGTVTAGKFAGDVKRAVGQLGV